MMSGLSPIEPAAAWLVAALLNSLWQGTVFFATAWLVLRALPFLNATTRYVVWCVALLALVALPFSSGWSASSKKAGPEESGPGRVGGPLTSLSASELVVLERPRDDSEGKVAGSSERLGEILAKPTAVDDYGVFSISLDHAAPWIVPIQLVPNRWVVVAAFGWLVIASLMLGRVLWSYLYLHRLKQTSLPVAEHFRSRLGEWRRVSGSRRPVELRCSNRIPGPVAAGLSRPVILLPSRFVDELSAAELDQVGLHEMAHLARWDDWTNLVQKLVQAAFFFHPAVHWMGRQLHLEREIACDDWVIFRTGKPKPYAACLTRLVELTGRMDVPALAPGSWTTKKQISRRIEMSLNRSRNVTPRLSKASVFVSVLVLLFLGIQFARTFPLVRAAEQEEKAEEKVVPTKETLQEEAEEETLPEEVDEFVSVPMERPVTPDQAVALERAVEQESRERRHELEERQLAEREALMRDEAESRDRRRMQEERLIEQARRQRAEREALLAEERYRAAGRLQEFDAESDIMYSRPVLMGIDEEPAIPEDELIELMSEIVRNDKDSKVRSAALESIGRLGTEAASEALADLYDSLPDLELKNKALSSMAYSRRLTPKARAKLIDIAKTSPHQDLRRAALRALAGVPEEDGADALISVYDSTEQMEIKKMVIRFLSYNRSDVAIDKLKTIAREDSDAALRLEAVQSLGRLHSRGRFGIPRGELLFADEVPILAAPMPEAPPILPKPSKPKK